MFYPIRWDGQVCGIRPSVRKLLKYARRVFIRVPKAISRSICLLVNSLLRTMYQLLQIHRSHNYEEVPTWQLLLLMTTIANNLQFKDDFPCESLTFLWILWQNSKAWWWLVYSHFIKYQNWNRSSQKVQGLRVFFFFKVARNSKNNVQNACGDFCQKYGTVFHGGGAKKIRKKALPWCCYFRK